MNWILIHLALKYHGDFDKIDKALKTAEEIGFDEYENITKLIESGEIKAITILDDNYPESFKQSPKPPFVLFYDGNVELLENQNTITLTGQEFNESVDKYLKESLNILSNDKTLITQHQPWIDEKIIKHYDNLKKPTIYVSSVGVESFKKMHKIKLDKHELIVSTFPDNTLISKSSLKYTDYITASLSKSLVLYSSYTPSGFMSLVSRFLELGKDIYCYPGTSDKNDGNTYLIKQGCQEIKSSLDIK